MRAGVAMVVGWVGGCAPDEDRLRIRLEDRDPAVQARAIAIIADEKRHDLIPALVDRLDDEDPAIRLYAIIALEKLTGTRRGFNYAAPRASRRDAVTAWRNFIAEQAASPIEASPKETEDAARSIEAEQ